MQKTITSKVLSLLLTLVLSLGTLVVVLATVQTASTTAWADTIGEYEVNFATNATTLNGITATAGVEEDLSSDGWGYNPITGVGERGPRISFPISFSGNAQESGRLTVAITGTPDTGGTFTDFLEVYVNAGNPIENNRLFQLCGGWLVKG